MPRAPLTESEKQVLRDRLAAAREKIAAKRAASKEVPTVASDGRRIPKKTPETKLDHDIRIWAERTWENAPLALCQERLALLRKEFETGCRLVGQRRDVNDPAHYKCFICHRLVADGKWVQKLDYLDENTGLFASIVFDERICYERFVNSLELQNKFKSLGKRPTAEAVA